jgi:glycosyltransferase involved in cell wall biosynthesis
MRILEVSTFYRTVGGAEIYMHQVTEALRARGHDVAMFAGSPDEARSEERLRIVQRPDFHAGRLIHDADLSAALADFAKAFQPDLIHLHNTYSFPADFPAELAALGVPICQTVHDWSLLCTNAWCVVPPSETEAFRVCEGGPGKKCLERGCGANYPFDERVLLAAVLRLKAARASVANFTAPSAFLANMLADHGLGPAHALPLWIEPESFGGQAAFDQALSEVTREPHRMLFVGRLDKEKGLVFLIEALPAILRDVPDAHLALVGDGTETDALKAKAKELGVAKAVTFYGKIPHDEVVRHMARAAVQVLPSVWCENSPLTCYESLLAGLPMAASNIAGLPSMVRPGETGVLFEPRNPGSLAKTLVELFQNPVAHAALVQGCLKDVERYSKAAHMERLLEIFDQALEIGARPGDIDLDLFAASSGVLHKAKEVEDWANGMNAHIGQLMKNKVKGFVDRLRG